MEEFEGSGDEDRDQMLDFAMQQDVRSVMLHRAFPKLFEFCGA